MNQSTAGLDTEGYARMTKAQKKEYDKREKANDEALH